MPLPAQLLAAIAAPDGGRVVLVLGAGCSFEAPTSLPLARALSEETHRQLVADGVIALGRCPTPADLTAVADVVFTDTGSQREMVERFPLARFRTAFPNEGTVLAAALLLEHAVTCILTLNFDLSLTQAVAHLGGQNVSILNGPHQHHQQGVLNVIYLHRNVESNPDDWILRSDSLATGWQNNWEECIAARVIAAPITVFVGMGSPAQVLTECLKKIRAAVVDETNAFLADPSDPAHSQFLRELNLGATSHIRMGWTEFATALASRLLEEHRSELLSSCHTLANSEGWATDHAADVVARLNAGGIIHCGKVRARWLMLDRPYLPWRGLTKEHIADLVLAIGYLEAQTGTVAAIHEDGVAEFRQGAHVRGVAIIAHGLGVKRWLSMEESLKQNRRVWGGRYHTPTIAMVSGVLNKPAVVSPPVSLVGFVDPASIISGPDRIELVSVDEVRGSADAVRKIVAA